MPLPFSFPPSKSLSCCLQREMFTLDGSRHKQLIFCLTYVVNLGIVALLLYVTRSEIRPLTILNCSVLHPIQFDLSLRLDTALLFTSTRDVCPTEEPYALLHRISDVSYGPGLATRCTFQLVENSTSR